MYPDVSALFSSKKTNFEARSSPMTRMGHVPCIRVDSAWSKAGHCPGIVRALFFSLKLIIPKHIQRDPEAGPHAPSLLMKARDEVSAVMPGLLPAMPGDIRCSGLRGDKLRSVCFNVLCWFSMYFRRN